MIDITKSVKNEIKQEIRLEFNNLITNIIPIYYRMIKKEKNISENLNTIFQDGIFYSDREYEDNNVPNYALFNKHVFDFQRC